MKDTIELILIFCFIASVCFVFSGEPDLWDKWHAQAIGEQTQVECTAVGKAVSDGAAP